MSGMDLVGQLDVQLINDLRIFFNGAAQCAQRALQPSARTGLHRREYSQIIDELYIERDELSV